MRTERHKTRIEQARQLRKNMTPWERRLWYTFLRRHTTHFYRQRPFGPYILDFYCPSIKLAIELDGSQHFEVEGREYDMARDTYLMERGVKVMRIANIDIDRHFQEVCAMIDQEIIRRKG